MINTSVLLPVIIYYLSPRVFIHSNMQVKKILVSIHSVCFVQFCQPFTAKRKKDRCARHKRATNNKTQTKKQSLSYVVKFMMYYRRWATKNVYLDIKDIMQCNIINFISLKISKKTLFVNYLIVFYELIVACYEIPLSFGNLSNINKAQLLLGEKLNNLAIRVKIKEC